MNLPSPYSPGNIENFPFHQPFLFIGFKELSSRTPLTLTIILFRPRKGLLKEGIYLRIYQRIKTYHRRSQDGVTGGYRICISAQLGHPPGTSGEPRTPWGMGGTPSDRVGCGAWGEWRGGGEVEARQDWCPWEVAGGGEGIPCPKGEIGGPLGGQRIKRESDQGSHALLGPQEAVRSRAWSSAHQGTLQPCRSWWSGREGRGSKS